MVLGCCDASDVIDGEECIISIMRGLGGNNVNSLLPGVGVHFDEAARRISGRMLLVDEGPVVLQKTGANTWDLAKDGHVWRSSVAVCHTVQGVCCTVKMPHQSLHWS